MKSRKEYILEKFKQFNGNRIPAIFFKNDNIKYIMYWYDEETDCIKSDNISIPFHYEIDKIDLNLIDRVLFDLEYALKKHYKDDLGIELISFDD